MKLGQPLNQISYEKNFSFQACFYFKITNKELCTHMLYSVAFFKILFCCDAGCHPSLTGTGLRMTMHGECV